MSYRARRELLAQVAPRYREALQLLLKMNETGIPEQTRVEERPPRYVGRGADRSVGGADRGAEFHSAVSRNWIPQGRTEFASVFVRPRSCRVQLGDTAEYNSALQQDGAGAMERSRTRTRTRTRDENEDDRSKATCA